MDRADYQRLLLTHAVHAMACDGEVHADEVAEVRDLVKTTPYFDELDAAAETGAAVSALRKDGPGTIRSGVDALAQADLTPVQRLRVMEVVLSVVRADHVVEDQERTYLGAVREALGLTTADLVTRFPSDLGLLMIPPTGEFGSGAVNSGGREMNIAGLDDLAL